MLDPRKKRTKPLIEELGITFHQEGDYLIPDIELDEQPEDIGIYGRKRLNYLKEHKNILYSTMELTGELFPHLAEINKEALEQIDLLMEQLAKQYNINEQLKAQDQMKWVQETNMIKAMAEEIVLKEIVYR